MPDNSYIIILAGVAGAGKTTVGKLLASRRGWDFLDADDFHSSENIEKMSSGISLTDEDRKPWLEAIKSEIERVMSEKKSAVIACSALKEKYRKYLGDNSKDVIFFLLNVDYQEAYLRLSKRGNHFFGVDVLKSQFETLEKTEGTISIDASKTPEEITDEILKKLGF